MRTLDQTLDLVDDLSSRDELSHEETQDLLRAMEYAIPLLREKIEDLREAEIYFQAIKDQLEAILAEAGESGGHYDS